MKFPTDVRVAQRQVWLSERTPPSDVADLREAVHVNITKCLRDVDL